MKMHEDVVKFHRKYGLKCPPKPTPLSREELINEIANIERKITELGKSSNFVVQVASLVDLIYYAMGIAVDMGLPWGKLWDDVQRSNMLKARDGVGAIYKPPSFQEPYTEYFLKKVGYEKP